MHRRDFLVAGGSCLAALAVGARSRAYAHWTDELARLDGMAQAELVRKREVKPRELVEAAIRRIEQLNPDVNAVVTTMFDRALERADALDGDGVLQGVPFLVKDLCPYEGVRLTYGSRFFRDHVADATPELIRRMERAGMVAVGKSATPEFGLLPTTESVLQGPTKNPWQPEHSPGGSSGGAAAAVAAAMVPVAHASDGGGSIRIPATCCGVFGMKISRGRNPQGMLTSDQGLSVNHCVSRSVRDSAALLDATRGALTGDRWLAPEPPRPYLEEVAAKPRRLTIAFTSEDFSGNRAHPDCVAAVQSTAALCRELGHEVVEARPSVDGEAFSDAFIVLWGAIAGGIIARATAALGRKPPEGQFEPWTWQLAEFNEQHTSAAISAAWAAMQPVSYEMARFLGRYDVLLTPVLGAPPIKSGELPSASAGFGETLERLRRYVAFTPVCNATGQPAMSVPLNWNDAGLPIGSHFIGRHGDESTLFRLAAQLEQARPWADRRPQLSAS